MSPADDRYRRSVALHDRASKVIPGGVNSNFRLGRTRTPLFASGGRAGHVTDVDGNLYVDYLMGMGSAILGHSPDRVMRAAAETLTSGPTLAAQSELEVQLAEMIVSLVPSAEQVRLACTGSEVVQLALRIARAATGRQLAVKFEGHYHGWLDSVLVSTNPPKDGGGPDEWPVPYLQSAGQSPAAASDLVVLPWNDATALERHFEDLGDRTAALLMEPILCNTCVIMPGPGFLEQARELCNRHGTVLIFDEVITCFRVGPHGAQGMLGVTPDLTTMGKALGAGFPIAALGGRAELMQFIVTPPHVVHGGTFNANLPSTAAALAALQVLSADQGGAYLHLDVVGQRLISGLRELGQQMEPRLHVQGLGAVFNTTFMDADAGDVRDYRSYQRTDLARQERFLMELQDRGVRVTSRGTWFPSTAHTEEDVDRTLEAAERALAAVGTVQ